MRTEEMEIRVIALILNILKAAHHEARLTYANGVDQEKIEKEYFDAC